MRCGALGGPCDLLPTIEPKRLSFAFCPLPCLLCLLAVACSVLAALPRLARLNMPICSCCFGSLGLAEQLLRACFP